MCQKLQKRSLAGPLDWKRVGRFAVVGATIHGPFFLYGFGWLDKVITGAQGFKTVSERACAHMARACERRIPGSACAWTMCLCRDVPACPHVQALTKTALGQVTLFPVYLGR
jgi:hypothetical protein